MAKLPRIEVREASLFGDADPEQLEGGRRDRFYLPGWSDRRAKWEEDVRAWERGGRHGKPPAPLPHRLQFVSVERALGVPDGTKMAEFAADGYRPLKWDEAKAFGLDLGDETRGYACAARPDAQGNVRVGSQVLTVTDARHAATNLARVAQRQAGMENAIRDRLDSVAAAYNRERGHSAEGGTAFELVEEPAPAADAR